MNRKQYRPMSKLDRKLQDLRNWIYEMTNTKLLVAAFIFMIVAELFFKSLILK